MKRININEKAYDKLVNEISYGLVNKTSKKAYDTFHDLDELFGEFYDALEHDTDRFNPYVKKIKQHADVIYDILASKRNQIKNFDNELDNFDNEKFYDEDEDGYGYDDLDLRTLQNKYPKR